MPTNAKIDYFIERTDKHLESIDGKLDAMQDSINSLKGRVRAQAAVISLIVTFVYSLVSAYVI